MSASPRKAETILRRLEWTVIRRLDGMLYGDYRTLFRGNGVDLADLREYQYHDDVRHIDWNVTARLQTPYVREFHEDREVTAWFLLDLSPDVGKAGVHAQCEHLDALLGCFDDSHRPQLLTFLVQLRPILQGLEELSRLL